MADGTDLSEAMCRVCSEKAKSKGYNLNIFPANMTEFNILGLAVRYGQEF